MLFEQPLNKSQIDLNSNIDKNLIPTLGILLIKLEEMGH